MHARVFLCVYQYMKFEVPSFTDSKDMARVNVLYKNGSRDPDCAH